MKAEDFSGWLCAIAGLSAAQRGAALEALKRAEGQEARSGSEVSPEAERAKAAKRDRREDALGTTSHERVESQGCPHCAGREVSAGAARMAFCGFAARAAGARS